VGARADDWEGERAPTQAVAAAGATWWMEFIEPADLEETRAGVTRGPLRID